MSKEKRIVSASMLASDFSQSGKEAKAVAEAGTDWLHVDVMDGVFVPNITVGIPFVEAMKSTVTIPLDVHLMIVQPEKHIHAFAKAGANILTIHCENNPNIHFTLMEIRRLGVRPAVAINPGTPAVMVEPILPMIDMVLVMTVNPGFGGQKFIPETLAKIRQIRQWSDERNLNLNIQVDGGINGETAGLCADAGANVFVAGTAIFGHPDGYAAGIRALRGNATPAANTGNG